MHQVIVLLKNSPEYGHTSQRGIQNILRDGPYLLSYVCLRLNPLEHPKVSGGYLKTILYDELDHGIYFCLRLRPPSVLHGFLCTRVDYATAMCKALDVVCEMAAPAPPHGACRITRHCLALQCTEVQPSYFGRIKLALMSILFFSDPTSTCPCVLSFSLLLSFLYPKLTNLVYRILLEDSFWL